MSRLRHLFGSCFCSNVSRIDLALAYEGGMSAKQYMAITGASKATTKPYLFIHKFLDTQRMMRDFERRVQ